MCQVISSLPQPIGRRRQVSNLLSCHACCSGDFCNDRCNTTVATTTLAMKTATPTVLTSSTILSTTSFLSSATSMQTTTTRPQTTSGLISKATSTRATTSQSISSSRSTLTSISSILPSTSTVSAAGRDLLNIILNYLTVILYSVILGTYCQRICYFLKKRFSLIITQKQQLFIFSG